MAEQKIPCPNCPGEMVFQTFTNCFQQTVEFYECVECYFRLDSKAAVRLKRKKTKAA